MARRSRLWARRRELGFTQKAVAADIPVHPDTYARWEHGTRRPRLYQHRPLAAALQVPLTPTPDEHGLDWYLVCDDEAAIRPASATMDDVNRRDLIRGSAALGVTAVVATPAMLDPPPGRIGATEVAELRTMRNRFRATSFSQGGGGIELDDAIARLRDAARLLHGDCPDRVRSELCTALGALANTVGFAVFDVGRHDDARRILRFALACGEDAGNWGLRARTLAADLAPVELWTGSPDDALTLVEQAQVRADRLTATERAMTWSSRARAHARMEDVQAALEAVGRADEELASAQPGESPEMRWYTAAEHDAAIGDALVDLALATGTSVGEAVKRQRSAIAGFSDDYARSRAHARAQLATLLMSAGDPAEAVVEAEKLLDHVGDLRSHRTRWLVARLDHHAARHADRPDVVGLRHRLAS